MIPTKERNHQALLLTHKEEGLLFDCGEGTQRQLKIAGIKPTKITRIFISHWHGDHVLGLPGLLQTLNSLEYERCLEIYGPLGTKKRVLKIFSAFNFTVGYEFKVSELKDNALIDLKELEITARVLDHSLLCLGFSVIEKDKRKIKKNFLKKNNIPDGPHLKDLKENKAITWNNKRISPDEATFLVRGKKITIILDTVPCKNALDLAKKADLLISEAVYSSQLNNKAIEYKHMTAKQAAQLAVQADAKQLILTHFSQRYKTTEALCEEAEQFFKNTKCAFDFMKITV